MLGDDPVDFYVAATTKNASAWVKDAVKPYARHVFELPDKAEARHSPQGVLDAMVDSLLLSRADLYVHHVVGGNPSSSFSQLVGALRAQEWDAPEPPAGRFRALLVSEKCSDACRITDLEPSAFDLSWHSMAETPLSCGHYSDLTRGIASRMHQICELTTSLSEDLLEPGVGREAPAAHAPARRADQASPVEGPVLSANTPSKASDVYSLAYSLDL